MLRSKLLIAALAAIIGHTVQAQELFVYNEPASNMPAHTVGVRLTNQFMPAQGTNRANYYLAPEVMWGANKRLMLHAEGFFNNVGSSFSATGAGVYAKYRFYSTDKVYRHFRMAAFGRAAYNSNPMRQEEIATNGNNTGYQLGLIGTQLLHKTAISVTAYYEQADDRHNSSEPAEFPVANAVNYHLSAGRLLLPKTYTSYKQTNMNMMVELMGQQLLQNGKTYLDIAPSIQFIFNSQTRLDIGYKQQLYSAMQRIAPNGLLIRVEHLFYHII